MRKNTTPDHIVQRMQEDDEKNMADELITILKKTQSFKEGGVTS